MLEAVGFDVELDLVQNVADQTQKIYIDKDFDIATAAISVHEEGVYSRIATALGTGSPTNGGGYSSPEMDALIHELQGKKTPEDAKDVRVDKHRDGNGGAGQSEFQEMQV